MAKGKRKKGGKTKRKVEAKVVDTFKKISNNKLVADVVAAALVATAAALKDSEKARRFASEAGDQLEKLSKEGAERGSAMWALALDIGRRALDSVGADKPAKGKGLKPKAPEKRTPPAKPKAAAKPKSVARPKPSAKPRAKRAAKKA